MSEVKTDKLSPRTASGTVTLGTSGDTFSIPSGGTLDVSSATMTGFTIPSGQTLTIDSGGTIANNGSSSGFGSPAYASNASATDDTVNVDANDNLQFNSGYGSTATVYGCRAWVRFNGAGTVVIWGSGNVSSITDNGIGTYIVNFTNSMVDTNYSAPTSLNTTTGRSDVHPSSFTTTSVRLRSFASAVLTDYNHISLVILR